MYDYFKLGESEQYQFLQLPWLLIKDQRFKKLSDSSKILYSLLLNRTSLSAKNSWVDEQGNIYIIYTLEQIMEDLNCFKEKATKAMKELKDEGLVESIRRGLGKPNIIYVKNFATSLKYTPKTPQPPVNTQKFGNRTSGSSVIEPLDGLDSELQEVRKSNGSNNDLINNDSIYTESESRSTSDGTVTTDDELSTSEKINSKRKGKEPLISTAVQSTETRSSLSGSSQNPSSVKYDYNTYKQMIQDNIEYSHYAEHRSRDLELIDEIVNCMLDVICSVGDTVKIAGEEKSRAMVISQYLKINSQDVEHVIEKYKEQRHKITHTGSYIKTMLFTVKQEAGFNVTNQVRVDGVVW